MSTRSWYEGQDMSRADGPLTLWGLAWDGSEYGSGSMLLTWVTTRCARQEQTHIWRAAPVLLHRKPCLGKGTRRRVGIEQRYAWSAGGQPEGVAIKQTGFLYARWSTSSMTR